MSDTLSTLESDLLAFANPQRESDTGSPKDWEDGTATTTALLDTVSQLLTDLGTIGVIGPAITALTAAISQVLPDVANALNKIAEAVATIDSQDMQALGNALSLAQSLSPGKNPALTSGSQLFNNLSQLLAGKPPDQAATTLFQIAQQLTAIGKAL